VASDEAKLLYVLMQPGAHEGTHKDPATEVWVYNVSTKTRVSRLRLVRPGSSISLSHGAAPLLLVQSGELLDVYDSHDGALLRSMDLPGLRTRMQFEPVR
jgi:methylamine dehydrogenase heavy chain